MKITRITLRNGTTEKIAPAEKIAPVAQKKPKTAQTPDDRARFGEIFKRPKNREDSSDLDDSWTESIATDPNSNLKNFLVSQRANKRTNKRTIDRAIGRAAAAQELSFPKRRYFCWNPRISPEIPGLGHPS